MNGLPKDAESAQDELLRKALQRCRSQSIEEDNMQKMLSDFNVELVREKFLAGVGLFCIYRSVKVLSN